MLEDKWNTGLTKLPGPRNYKMFVCCHGSWLVHYVNNCPNQHCTEDTTQEWHFTFLQKSETLFRRIWRWNKNLALLTRLLSHPPPLPPEHEKKATCKNTQVATCWWSPASGGGDNFLCQLLGCCTIGSWGEPCSCNMMPQPAVSLTQFYSYMSIWGWYG